MHYQRQKGTFDEELFPPYKNYLRTLAAIPCFRAYWAERSDWYLPTFRGFMADEIFAHADETIYRKYIDGEV